MATLVALLIGWQGCSRLDARRRERADVAKREAEAKADSARMSDAKLDSLIAISERRRVDDSVRLSRALAAAERDRGARVIEYRTITDPAALRLLARKDTTIDSLSVVVQRQDTLVRDLRLERDVAHGAAVRWRSAYDARSREAGELRKGRGPWWKERIRPQCVLGAGGGLTRENNVELQRLQITCGFQVFP